MTYREYIHDEVRSHAVSTRVQIPPAKLIDFHIELAVKALNYWEKIADYLMTNDLTAGGLTGFVIAKIFYR